MLISDDWWTNGLCSSFAAYLKERFGGELWAIVNHSRKCNDDQLLHCYCVINGIAYDANGGHNIKKASNISRWSIPEMDKEHDVEIQWKKVDENWLNKVHEDFNPAYYDEAKNYVDRHPDLFPKN